jgi:FkbM family methyltransferase
MEWFRRAWPHRVVHRHVQGIDLTMPWFHQLPDYARLFPDYGQNLVEVAAAIAASESESFGVIDIGANIGDSALQILARVDARVLCVEGDTYWLEYLRRNVEAEARICVEAALVLPNDVSPEALRAERTKGTTRFVAGETSGSNIGRVDAATLRERHPEIGQVRLVKSDTDGYDAQIVPAVARAWQDTHPVLFFEYAPELSRRAGDAAPEQVWASLSTLGYDRVLVWDNYGLPLGTVALIDTPKAALVFNGTADARRYEYWDVAVIHREDRELALQLEGLVNGPVLGIDS